MRWDVLIAAGMGAIPALTLLAVLWKRSRTPMDHGAHEIAKVAERNLRSYVTRHVPEGPDRLAALCCIDVLRQSHTHPQEVPDA